MHGSSSSSAAQRKMLRYSSSTSSSQHLPPAGYSTSTSASPSTSKPVDYFRPLTVDVSVEYELPKEVIVILYLTSKIGENKKIIHIH